MGAHNYPLGAVLRRPIDLPWPPFHYGIVVQVVPQALVVENQKLHGVREVSIDVFADGKPVEVRYVATTFSVEEIVTRARSRLGEAYEADGFNCEDLVNWVFEGKTRSLQTDLTRLACLTTPFTRDLLEVWDRVKDTKKYAPALKPQPKKKVR